MFLRSYCFIQHAAPEDDEDVRVEEKIQVVRPQKSYKIIFIKAPSGGSQINAANYPIYPQVRLIHNFYFFNEQIIQLKSIPQTFNLNRTKRRLLFTFYQRRTKAFPILEKSQHHHHPSHTNQKSSSLNTRRSKKLPLLSPIFKVNFLIFHQDCMICLFCINLCSIFQI